MANAGNHNDDGYDKLYEDFDSTLWQKLRREAYGEDIFQHSWVTANELKESLHGLQLTSDCHILDLGCGPAGPLSFIAGQVGCRGSGVDLSSKAISAGRKRVATLDLEKVVTLCESDLNEPIPFASGTFDAVVSLDVILHLRDRLSIFREVARVLVAGGRFLFTDAGVITGAISEADIASRALHGHTQFVPPGLNVDLLRLAGFEVIDEKDRTGDLVRIASGRLSARLRHREELESLEGSSCFERQVRYFETVIDLSRRGALSRLMYLARACAN